MPQEGQASITVPRWVWEKAKKFYEEHKDFLKKMNPPITSATALVTYWIQQKSSEKRLDHFNTFENHVTVRDNFLDRFVDVLAVPNGKGKYFHFYCEECDSTSCLHVQYVEKISPKTIKPLEEQGWKYKPNN